jgi:hypothetical protein
MRDLKSCFQTDLLKKAVCAGFLVTAVFGCAIANPIRGSVIVSAWSTNYTEEYIASFHLQAPDGTPIYLGGSDVKAFSKGGTGGRECCATIRGVGEPIRVVWTASDKEVEYGKDVKVIGSMPKAPSSDGYLIVRFFPDHEIEVELVPGDDLGPGNPRVDSLFSAKRVMRYKGE